MREYNPPQHICDQCGTLFITRNPQEYLFKIRQKKGKTLWFCKPSCKRKWEDEHPKKQYRSVKI